MRCPFIYANGKQCEGVIEIAWQKLFRTKKELKWKPVDGEWIDDEENDKNWEEACSVCASRNPGGMSHIHLVCSLKGGHGGIMPDNPQMKVWGLPELDIEE